MKKDLKNIVKSRNFFWRPPHFSLKRNGYRPMTTSQVDEIDEPGDFIPVYTTDDPSELALIRSFLDYHNIKHYVSGEDLLFLTGGALPFFSGGAVIYVQEKDEKFLNEFLNGEIRE